MSSADVDHVEGKREPQEATWQPRQQRVIETRGYLRALLVKKDRVLQTATLFVYFDVFLFCCTFGTSPFVATPIKYRICLSLFRYNHYFKLPI